MTVRGCFSCIRFSKVRFSSDSTPAICRQLSNQTVGVGSFP